MNENIFIIFSLTQEAALGINADSQAMHDLFQKLQFAINGLYASGLQGAFVESFDTRCTEILNRLRYLRDETDESGRDLLAVVEILRQLDTQCALRFDTYSHEMIDGMGRIPVAAGGAYVGDANRLIVIDDSILRLRRIQESIRNHIADIDLQLQNKLGSLISSLFGYDYEEMRAELVNSLARTETRIDELIAERTQIEQTLANDVSLTEDQPSIQTNPLIGPNPVNINASITSAANFVGRSENLQSPTRRQYSYQYTGKGNDRLACALYSQVAVLEALGHNFDQELIEARELGLIGADGKRGTEDDWFSETGAAEGLGQPFAANNIPYETYWGQQPPNGETITRESALNKLRSEIEAGNYPVLTFDAQQLSDFSTGSRSDQAVKGHAAWIVGLQVNDTGEITDVIANDSHWGEIKYYPVDEFISAWGHPGYDYYAVFARKPD
jgi:hypothetical protein